MAKLGSVYLDVVEADKISRAVKVSEHPLETGESVADHIAPQQQTFPIKGVIVGADASKRMKQLEEFAEEGRLLRYVNRISVSNVIITNFDSDHVKTVANGFEFTITLRRIKIVGATKTEEMTVPARVKIKKEANKGAQQKKTTSDIKSKKKTKDKAKSKKKDNSKKSTGGKVKQSGKSPAQLAKENGYKNKGS